MDALFRLVLTNAALSGLLALSAWAASRLVRRQAVVHTLWLLALVKLVTPPLVALPVLPVRVERATPAPGRAAKESDAPPALATRATRAEVSASAAARMTLPMSLLMPAAASAVATLAVASQ